MTEVILINFRNERDMYPPFGIMYVADALIQQGLSVELWHSTADELDDFVLRTVYHRVIICYLHK